MKIPIQEPNINLANEGSEPLCKTLGNPSYSYLLGSKSYWTLGDKLIVVSLGMCLKLIILFHYSQIFKKAKQNKTPAQKPYPSKFSLMSSKKSLTRFSSLTTGTLLFHEVLILKPDWKPPSPPPFPSVGNTSVVLACNCHMQSSCWHSCWAHVPCSWAAKDLSQATAKDFPPQGSQAFHLPMINSAHSNRHYPPQQRGMGEFPFLASLLSKASHSLSSSRLVHLCTASTPGFIHQGLRCTVLLKNIIFCMPCLKKKKSRNQSHWFQ